MELVTVVMNGWELIVHTNDMNVMRLVRSV